MPAGWKRWNRHNGHLMGIRRHWLSSVALLLLVPMQAQLDSIRMRYALMVDQVDLRRHLDTLASDRYEGRETGMAGQKMAARYIRGCFQKAGIGPVPGAQEKGLTGDGYEQPFPLEVSTPGGISMVIDGRPLGFMQEFFLFQDRGLENFRTDTVLLATGPALDASARNKVVLMLQDERPGKFRSDRPPADFFQEFSRKTRQAEAAGVKLLLLCSPHAPALMRQYAHFITAPRMRLVNGGAGQADSRPLQVIVIDRPSAERILARAGMRWRKAHHAHAQSPTIIPCPFIFENHPMRQALQGENVLGYLEGTDRKDEVVVVTAHYDHIGKEGGEVYNGADDDGSGTVAVLEMAEAFARAKAEGHGPRRSMLFMPVSGEEKGLLGSEWYSEHPVFPLERTVADLNIDMIGRTDSAHAGAAPYVYIIGSDRLSTELHAINEQANSRYVGLELDMTFNAENDPERYYYRSDHYNFARKGVPVIFYFSGVHEDYHQPGDEVGKIRFDLLETRARLVFHTAWELANRDARPLVDKPVPRD